MTDFNILQKRIIQGDPFEKCNGTVVVSEKGQSMLLNIVLSGEAWCVKNMDNKFESLKNNLRKRKCADTAIWMPTDSGQWVLHIIEMKKTVTRSCNDTSWDHIKRQFVGAYRICRMVAAALDIEIEQVVFYTAFNNDDDISLRVIDSSDVDDTEDPVAMRVDPDMPDDMPSPMVEWASGKCSLGDNGWADNYTEKRHTHIRIKMTELPNGTYESTYPCHQT